MLRKAITALIFILIFGIIQLIQIYQAQNAFFNFILTHKMKQIQLLIFNTNQNFNLKMEYIN